MAKLPEVPEEMRALIRAKCEYYVERIRARYPRMGHLFRVPEIAYNVRGSSAGWAHSHKNLIRLNPFFLLDARTAPDMLDDTIPHECAHLFTHIIYPGASAHGPEWTAIFKLIEPNATFKRTHNYDVSIARPNFVQMEFVCSAHCGKKFYLGPNRQKKALKGQRICLACGYTLKPNVENSI